MHVHILYTINTTINAEPNFVWFSLSSFIHNNNIQTWWRFVHEYVYSQWWYCADRSYAFLSMGGVRSRKYCASISDMTTTWGLCREVVLRINLPRASIEAWRMLWHFSMNGSCGWLRYWGKGYVCREISSARITSWEMKYGNSNSGTFELQQYHCRSLPYGEHIILLEYQYILVCWMKGTTTRLKVYLR